MQNHLESCEATILRHRYRRNQILTFATSGKYNRRIYGLGSCTVAIIRYLKRKHPFAVVSEHMMGRRRVSDNRALRGVPLELFKCAFLGTEKFLLVRFLVDGSRRRKDAIVSSNRQRSTKLYACLRNIIFIAFRYSCFCISESK